MVTLNSSHTPDIFVVDFGSQTAHLITRRLKDLGVSSILVDPDEAYQKAKKENPAGIIFSGGPASVYEKGAPTIDKKIFRLPVTMLDICYGLQLRSHLLNGKVVSGTKEYGPVSITLNGIKSPMSKGLPKAFTVWMSHGDSVLSMPNSFVILGSSDRVKYAFVADETNKHYGVQFHPEIEHTEFGNTILNNFIDICDKDFAFRPSVSESGARQSHPPSLRQAKNDNTIETMIENIKKTVGDGIVVGAVSGGVDSTVAGTLVAKAIGRRFFPIFVDNGLMRPDAASFVKEIFDALGVKPRIVKAEKDMLQLLKGKTDSEEKRKIIGKFYIDVFEREVQKIMGQGRLLLNRHPELDSGSHTSVIPAEAGIYINKLGSRIKSGMTTLNVFLLQGTIFSDVIESKGSKHASHIKSHHNVGGLPKNLKLTLLEPLRQLYKDEVRALGRQLSLSEKFVQKQVFPGPGYAVRIRGEVTAARLHQEKKADAIVLEELQKAGWLEKVYMSFPVMTGALSTAVKGDGRFFGEVVALRIIESADVMSTIWSRLPYEILQKISSRIVNEVPGISRVVYDITSKPPATMEWE